MKKWIQEDWNNIFHNSPPPRSSGKILYADMHRAQQTPDLNCWLHKCRTTLINVPGGTTSRVQPIDVSINKPFKNYVHELFKHSDANLELRVNGKLTAGERHVLTIKWVGEAWERVKKQKDCIKHSFKKCSLSSNLAGTKIPLLTSRASRSIKCPCPQRSTR